MVMRQNSGTTEGAIQFGSTREWSVNSRYIRNSGAPMLKKYTKRGFFRPRRQKAIAAQIVATKNTGFISPNSAPRNSPRYLSVGFQGSSIAALPATC